MCRKTTEMKAATPAERKAMGIPPAYTDVMISVEAGSDLVATAKTPKGKTFYKYSAEFIARQADRKWKRVRKLNERIAKVEARIERDCRDVESPDRHVAMTARLILLTGLRNGGAAQGEKEAFGASNLLLRHVNVVGSTVELDFPGKHGVRQQHSVCDALFVKYARDAQGREELFPHDANATLRYMKKVGAAKVHDLRTWRANLLARTLVEELLKLQKPETAKAKKAIQKAVATKVAEVLGNKPGQALKSYIDPGIWKKLEG
jgi:DNA topoisomerase-1